jgi:hypothetical protein
MIQSRCLDEGCDVALSSQCFNDGKAAITRVEDVNVSVNKIVSEPIGMSVGVCWWHSRLVCAR